MIHRVRVKIGDCEIEVEGTPTFIKSQLTAFYQRTSFSGPSQTSIDLPKKIAETAKKAKPASPAEYFRLKNPQSGTELLVVLAKYLEDYRSQSEFAAKEINSLAKEAKLNDIHGQYYTNAVKQGFIRQASKGRYSLTLSGEDVVAAMPAKNPAR